MPEPSFSSRLREERMEKCVAFFCAYLRMPGIAMLAML